MKRNFAYETYRSVEADSNYKTARDRKRYEDVLTARTKQTELPFLRKHFRNGTGSVLEVGSGSGRILHALLLAGLAKSAVGIEISPSRVRFGKKWAHKLGLSRVSHRTGDFLSMDVPEKFDAILCVTSIFPFFDMLEKGGLMKALRKMKKSLRPQGAIVLESVTFNNEVSLSRVSGGSARVWEEYAKGDPFRFNLVEYILDEKKRVLVARSQNVMRDRAHVDAPTIKKWHLESAETLGQSLRRAGFRNIRFFGDFNSSVYKEGKSPRIIAIADT
ncbi:hypothetical protein A3C86_01480 [Candidatus Kaiserbacteria bacterium RIFCSPHIGHO2_02_FULL_49_16]|uniref:Methyltransferase domain-containing protein n=1 Tax=Candidatus Kaiserbacteria bacterium RIFCSPHIGHO2_02_FULL_49_16 TaxID=1798490 RepID=A0A1F6DD08_9BACT|nr:MAG: hypothetical protein A3C86_01480 [Candidatus Kaiserbacteria bacterium RIFCSPHIGHO2_02_FULL_49_16]